MAGLAVTYSALGALRGQAGAGGTSGGGFSLRADAAGEASGVGVGTYAGLNGINYALSLTELGWSIPGPGWIAAGAGLVFEVLNDIFDFFGGGGSVEIPRQLKHARHAIYDLILGIARGLIVTEGAAFGGSAVPPPGFPPKRPLQKAGSHTDGVQLIQFPGYNWCGPGNDGGPAAPGTTDYCCKQHDLCYGNQLSGLDVLKHLGGLGAGPLQRKCDRALCDCVNGLKTSPLGTYDRRTRTGIGNVFCY